MVQAVRWNTDRGYPQSASLRNAHARGIAPLLPLEPVGSRLFTSNRGGLTTRSPHPLGLTPSGSGGGTHTKG